RNVGRGAPDTSAARWLWDAGPGDHSGCRRREPASPADTAGGPSAALTLPQTARWIRFVSCESPIAPGRPETCDARAVYRTGRPTMITTWLKLGLELWRLPARAVAAAVREWNEIAVATAAAGKHGASDASRTTALVHATVFDAVNAIEARYTPYKIKVSAPAGASAEAAAVGAAHAVLVRLYPDQKNALDQQLAKGLAGIPDGTAKRDGIAVGDKVAAGMVALRMNDGATAPNTYRPVTAPGVYVATTLPVSTQWVQMTPWLLERPS